MTYYPGDWDDEPDPEPGDEPTDEQEDDLSFFELFGGDSGDECDICGVPVAADWQCRTYGCERNPDTPNPPTPERDL